MAEATKSPAEILGSYAERMGLSAHIAPFAHGGSLAERLAENPLLMAPMAGVTDAAWRILARAGGAALAYSEMVSATGLHYKSDKTWELVVPNDAEPDIAVQLFGHEPAYFREATSAIASRLGKKLALIDVNMACPMPKVTKDGSGSALLDDPARAQEIIAACRAGIDEVSEAGSAPIPVTAKIRRGRRMGEEQAPEFARALEAAGAAAVAIHGRFANQLYRGEADWGAIARVADAVDIPVIGSGDVHSHADAERMRQETGCAAVMIARGTYGNPWVFQGTCPAPEQRLAAFCCHVQLLDACDIHLARARKLASWYFRGMPEAAKWRGQAMECDTLEDYLALADRVAHAITEG
ncbi:MAG: tRNA-dihydrouridine synthase [Coriobacteriales bacterium]|nr:tRNA-dihydrouridine synthase [Coriobacteriales bacterium]